MKIGFLGALLVVLCACKKEDDFVPSNNIEGKWTWISTAKDSTFYEDTSSSNNQILNLIDYKNIDWKRNDTVYYNGIYLYEVKQSVTLGTNKMIMNLSGIPYGFMLNRSADTLWIQEDRVGGYLYRFLKQ